MKSRCFWIAGALLAPIVFYGGVAAIVRASIAQFAEPALAQASIAVQAHLPAIVADLKALNETPLFPDLARAADAEPLLSRHIAWSGADDEPNVSELDKKAREVLLATHASRPSEDGKLEWLLSNHRIGEIDAAWVDGLLAFDHWDLHAHASFAAAIDRAIAAPDPISRIGILGTMPMPELAELQKWALTRAIQLRQSDPQKGLRLLQHVARLAATSQTLIGAMVAVALLNNAQRLAEAIPPRRWTGPSRALRESYRRASWAWALLLREDGGLPPEVAPYFNMRTGVCAGAQENLVPFSGLQDAFEPHWPLEPDFRAQIAESRRLTKAAFDACGMAWALPFLEAKPLSISVLAKNLFRGGHDAGTALIQLPLVRTAVALILKRVAIPSLRVYDQKPSDDLAPGSEAPLPPGAPEPTGGR